MKFTKCVYNTDQITYTDDHINSIILMRADLKCKIIASFASSNLKLEVRILTQILSGYTMFDVIQLTMWDIPSEIS